jgi:hypothetical protein
LSIRGRLRRQCAFRGSFIRPSASLSTLRRRPRGIGLRKTRFRLVASLCRVGFTYRVTSERFPLCPLLLHRFPLSQAYPGAQRLALLPGGASTTASAGLGSMPPNFRLTSSQLLWNFFRERERNGCFASASLQLSLSQAPFWSSVLKFNLFP